MATQRIVNASTGAKVRKGMDGDGEGQRKGLKPKCRMIHDNEIQNDSETRPSVDTAIRSASAFSLRPSIGLLLALFLVTIGSIAFLSWSDKQSLSENIISRTICTHNTSETVYNESDNGHDHEHSKFEFRFKPNHQTKIDFMHIPKSGGTSINKQVSRYSIVFRSDGETSWRDQVIADSHYVFTMLRYPPHHLVSMFKHCSESGDHHYGHDLVKNVPFRSWIRFWADVAEHYNGSFEETYLNGLRKKEIPFWCYAPVNLQATRIGGGTSDLDTLKDRVNNLFHVGVQDMFHETLCVLAFKVHGDTHKCCVCNASSECTDVHSRHGVAQYDPDAFLLDVDKADMDRLINLDQILYDIATKRLLWDIEYIREHHDKRFLCENE